MRLSILLLTLIIFPQIAPAEGCFSPSARADVAEAQTLLQRHGYDPRTVDGRMGPDTARAVVAFQSHHGLPADGQVDAELLNRLRAATQGGGSNALLAQSTPAPRIGFYQRYPWPSRMGGH